MHNLPICSCPMRCRRSQRPTPYRTRVLRERRGRRYAMRYVVSMLRLPSLCPWDKRFALRLATLLLCWVLSGCAAITNPVANGLPVKLLPPELLTRPGEDAQTIPLTRFGQDLPEV